MMSPLATRGLLAGVTAAMWKAVRWVGGPDVVSHSRWRHSVFGTVSYGLARPFIRWESF
jgi:hypothetical protein